MLFENAALSNTCSSNGRFSSTPSTVGAVASVTKVSLKGVPKLMATKSDAAAFTKQSTLLSWSPIRRYTTYEAAFALPADVMFSKNSGEVLLNPPAWLGAPITTYFNVLENTFGVDAINKQVGDAKHFAWASGRVVNVAMGLDCAKTPRPGSTRHALLLFVSKPLP